MHSATGFTPRHALFGWTPTDIRVPFQTAALKVATNCSPVNHWLKSRALEYARQAVLRAQKKDTLSHDYKTGDQVKVST